MASRDIGFGFNRGGVSSSSGDYEGDCNDNDSDWTSKTTGYRIKLANKDCYLDIGEKYTGFRSSLSNFAGELDLFWDCDGYPQSYTIDNVKYDKIYGSIWNNVGDKLCASMRSINEEYTLRYCLTSAPFDTNSGSTGGFTRGAISSNILNAKVSQSSDDEFNFEYANPYPQKRITGSNDNAEQFVLGTQSTSDSFTQFNGNSGSINGYEAIFSFDDIDSNNYNLLFIESKACVESSPGGLDYYVYKTNMEELVIFAGLIMIVLSLLFIVYDGLMKWKRNRGKHEIVSYDDSSTDIDDPDV